MCEFSFGKLHAETNLPTQLTCSEKTQGARSLYTFSLTWKPEDALAVSQPALTLSWQKDIVDIQYLWHSACGTNRAIQPDWSRSVFSKLSSGCPLHCFYNDAGQNRYTVALDDCVNRIERSIGVREENGALVCKVVIPLDGTGKTDSYQVTLWLDETDCRYEDTIRAVSAWWETKYTPMGVTREAKLPMYSFWYSFHQEVYAEQVLAECARAAQLGMKTVIIDDGWQTDDNSRGYAYCGDWAVAQAKIPDMRGMVEKIHALGLKIMLWYSVPFVGKYSQAALRFEGKTLDNIENLATYVLDPRYADVREYLINVYVQALNAWDLDGFKLDFIDCFRGRDEAVPAYREGMDYVVLEDAVRRLMVDVMNALRAIKPDILIEFRQTYVGPVMREFGNMIRVADCPATTSSNRIGMVDLRLTSGETAVHSDMLVWHVNDRVENAVCQIENVLFSTVQISVLLDKVPAEHVKAIRYWVDFMQKEQKLLLNTPIQADCPQMLYPLVRAEADGRSIIALYEKNYLAEIPASRLNEICLINANSGSELLTRFDAPGRFHAVARNCMGEVVREQDIACQGLMTLDVPECGLIELTRLA